MKNTILYVIIFALGIILFSCLPKEIRQKKRCNRKLERLIEKCPQLLNNDTIHDTISVKVPEILIKDSLTVRVDTFELEKLVPYDKIKEVVKSISIDTLILDSLYRLKISLYNGVFLYDIVIYPREVKKPIETIVNVVKPIELTLFEKFQVWYYGKWWLIPLILICVIIYLIIKKILR